MIFAIARSVIIAGLLSVGLAFSLKQFLGFWETFTLVFILQFIISFLWKNLSIKAADKVISELTQDINELLQKQQTTVECPCGKNTVPVVMFPTEELIITCDKCTNTFRVTTEYKTSLITEPLNMESIYNKLKELQ